MSESLKDLNAVINVGGALTHWNGVSSEGGELTEYNTTPIGGPPAADYDSDVREKKSFSITTKVMGVDAAARQTFIDKFARGTVFSGKTAPAGNSQFNITGEDVNGTDYIVANRTIGHTEAENSELTILLKEKGPTPAS